ncbi:MAG: iron dicitrate transport regulator FecR, partial [Planctomycetota bacterium]
AKRIFVWPQDPSNIATIVSSENAAWESSLPTRAGDALQPGVLHLKAGIATIRFARGAKLVLEAPATLELISDMRCRLNSGAAIVEVPDTALGFVVESPAGFAEDFGTRFAVRVDETNLQSGFELIEGEIKVHHALSGDSVRLTDVGATVLVSGDSIRRVEEEADSGINETGSEIATPTGNLQVIGTAGRCGTAMPRFNKRWKYIDPDVLSVKKTNSGKWDYRSFFAFDLSPIQWDNVRSVRLRLNLVPSKRGLASRLPRVNRFGVYGLTKESKSDWKIDSTWEESPGPDDGELLGTFEVQRSQNRGVFGIRGDKLLNFLRDHWDRPATLILVRLTTQIDGVGPGLTHTFASDSHSESVGPQLELELK